MLTTSECLDETSRRSRQHTTHIPRHLREQRDVLQFALLVDDAHAAIGTAIAAPEFCGGVHVAAHAIDVVSARADLVGEFGGGELVSGETGAGVAEAVAAEGCDEDTRCGRGAGADVAGGLGVDGEEGEGESCLDEEGEGRKERRRERWDDRRA